MEVRVIKNEFLERSVIIFRFIIFIAVLAGGLFLMRHYNTAKDNERPLDVYFLSTINDANATLLTQGANTILIDTGEKQDYQALKKLLKDEQIKTIDYLILTHPDKDHVGGMLNILQDFSVVHVIMPYYGKEHENLEKITNELTALEVSVTYPSRTRNFALGSIKLTVYPPLERHYKKDNNYSLATLVTHQQTNMLFVGDSESKRLQELMKVNWPTIDLYLVAHHGRANLSSESFIEQIKPKIAVTTASSNDLEVQNALKELASTIYFTNKQTLHFQSNGEKIERK